MSTPVIMRSVRIAGLAVAVLAAAIGIQCSGGSRGTGSPTGPTIPGPSTPSPGPPPTGGPETFVGAGDIAICGGNAEATARQLDGIGGTVFTLGDNAYSSGTRADFQNCYEPTWGRHKSRTRPAPGNHDYESPGAAPYFNYFGTRAGPAGLGYYSFEAGNWHVVSLNSNVPMSVASAQSSWLRDDLAAHTALCTAAIFHHPLFTVGPDGPSPDTRELWRVLYEAGVDVVINGHDHLYQRFARQDPQGANDPLRGIREFVVGTGGAELSNFVRPQANTETYVSTYGVLKLTLRLGDYDWQFLSIDGSMPDSGHDVCH